LTKGAAARQVQRQSGEGFGLRVTATWAGIGGLLCLATPAFAECGAACLNGIAAALASIFVYGVIGIVLLVMLIRAKWRRAGLRSLAIVVALAIGVPLISQAVQVVRLWAMERHEIVGELPDISQLTPLIIAGDGACKYRVCQAVLRGRWGKGVYVVPAADFARLDLTRPLEIDDLPLELWTFEDGSDWVKSRRLAPTERARAAAKIDYLLIIGSGYYIAAPTEIEAALRRNPAFASVSTDARVEFLLAPLDPLRPELTLEKLQPDLLDLSLTSWAMAFPLAPMNDQPANNSPVALDAIVRALCPADDGDSDYYCQTLLTR
jgi:hypothetical protein